jgi:hypothetical protein
VVLVGVVSAEAVLVAVASVAVAFVVVLAAAGSEAGLSAVDSVVQVFAAASSGVPALDRASASVTVSSSEIASLSPLSRSPSARVSMAPRVGAGCRPHGAGSVFGSAGITETNEAGKVDSEHRPSVMAQDAFPHRLHQIGKAAAGSMGHSGVTTSVGIDDRTVLPLKYLHEPMHMIMHRAFDRIDPENRCIVAHPDSPPKAPSVYSPK